MRIMTIRKINRSKERHEPKDDDTAIMGGGHEQKDEEGWSCQHGAEE